jgi:hypothetical protein
MSRMTGEKRLRDSSITAAPLSEACKHCAQNDSRLVVRSNGRCNLESRRRSFCPAFAAVSYDFFEIVPVAAWTFIERRYRANSEADE